MKKAALSFITVLATIGFSSESSAIPVFARQTGMACNVAAEWGVLPHGTIQAGFRSAKTGDLLNNVDNAIMVGGTYDLAMNVKLALNITQQSGSAWNGLNAAHPLQPNGQVAGKTASTLLLEVLF